LAALSIIFSAVGPVAAWGPVGHETVAFIAQDNLTPAAKTKINALLNGDPADSSLESAQPKSVAQPVLSPQALANISNWADDIREHGRPETAPWHFIDLPIRKDLTLKDEQEYCPNNDCVLNQLQIFEGILGDSSKPKSKRLEALKFIVHFMGDLHQPLHCADDGDRGGNEKMVRFKAPGHRGHGAKIKLHALWDHLIESKTLEDPRELATTLGKAITPEPFIDLNYQLELFEDLIRNMYRSGLSDFVNRYSKVSVMDNTTFVNNLRSYPLTDDTTKPIPESLTRTIELQKPLTAVIHFRVATLTARGIFLETLHKLNQKDPSLDINSLSNIWNEYLKCRRSYFQIIKILETIAHNSIHEAYDWNEFVSQLSKIELD
jgi:hypothetical protein